MPQPTRTLTVESAREEIRERSFLKTTGRRVGVELEWFTTPSTNPPDVATLERLLGPLELPARSRLTFEPGGQVEISSPPFESCREACDAAAVDTDAIGAQLSHYRIGMFAAGFDPQRPQRLLTDAPRYVAMRSYFDRYGSAGGRMMCATAAVHVNIDAGADDEGRRRWRAAHTVGPTLLAAFANSPIVDGGPSGWMSSRAAAWRTLDPSRTWPVGIDGDPSTSWADYALDARVMFIRSDGSYHAIAEPLTMRGWIEDGHEDGFPDRDDLLYHLTTLFPPVRPRGYLEIRALDMLPDPWWRVAVAVTTALVCDPQARGRAIDACARTADAWTLAARCGLEDPLLYASARECFDAARPAVARVGCDQATADALEDYVERFVALGRCPANDELDRYRTPTVEAV